jgi:hypothetical protein
MFLRKERLREVSTLRHGIHHLKRFETLQGVTTLKVTGNDHLTSKTVTPSGLFES